MNFLYSHYSRFELLFRRDVQELQKVKQILEGDLADELERAYWKPYGSHFELFLDDLGKIDRRVDEIVSSLP